jgi:hypothetical protein
MWAEECGHNTCARKGGKGCCLCVDYHDQVPYLQAYDCYLKGLGFTERELRERYHGFCVDCRRRMTSHHPAWERETSMSNSATKPFTEKKRRQLGKECRHGYCTLSNQEGCCACLDNRPLSKSYERFVDGRGPVNVSDMRERYRGYCPECQVALLGQRIPWDEQQSMVGVWNNCAPAGKKNPTRKERRASNPDLARKQVAKRDLDGVTHSLSHYNQSYRDQTRLNATKLAKVSDGSRSNVESRPSFANEKSSFIPTASASNFEAQPESSTPRQKPKFRFPSFSWHPFHKHKDPELIAPSTSTAVPEPPPFESDIPDSAPPPYTPYASDGTRFELPPRDEKPRG